MFQEMFSFEKAKTEGDVSALPTSHPAIVVNITLPGFSVGVARFIDASIYRDTFPRDTYRDIIFYNRNFFFFFFFKFFFTQLFSFRQKRYIIISTCDFCKVIPQIHSYFVKIFCEISVETKRYYTNNMKYSFYIELIGCVYYALYCFKTQ